MNAAVFGITWLTYLVLLLLIGPFCFAQSWVVHDCGGEFTVCIDDSGRMYGCGSNLSGVLGDSKSEIVPRLHQIGSEVTWIDVAAGSVYCIGIDDTRSLWAWGQNRLGLLGQGDTTDHAGFVLVDSTRTWSKVFAGALSAYAIDSCGWLWSWGFNYCGELGIGSQEERLTISIVDSTRRWSDLAVDGPHVLALTEDSTLYGWGLNFSKQVSPADEEMILKPIALSTDKWIRIAVGFEHSLAIRSDGGLYSWGGNTLGQCGHGSSRSDVHEPTRIELPARCISLAAGSMHSLAILDDGYLYGWGYNNVGQAGMPLSPKRIINPQRVLHVGTLAEVKTANGFFVGDGVMGFHSVVRSENLQTLIGTGGNHVGQIGSRSDNVSRFKGDSIHVPVDTSNQTCMTRADAVSVTIDSDDDDYTILSIPDLEAATLVFYDLYGRTQEIECESMNGTVRIDIDDFEEEKRYFLRVEWSDSCIGRYMIDAYR